MGMTSYESLLPRMVLELPGCPAAIVKLAAQRAAVRFCKDTGAWCEWLPAIDIIEGQARYLLSYEGASIYCVWGIKRKTSSSENFNDLSIERSFSVTGDSYLILDSAPASSIDDGLLVQVSLFPDWTMDSLPSALLGRYAEGIIGAAMQELMAQSAKPWSNPDRARAYGDTYFRTMNAATTERDTGLKAETVKLRIPYF